MPPPRTRMTGVIRAAPRSATAAASSTGRIRLRRRSSRRGPPPSFYLRPGLLLPHLDRAIIALDGPPRGQLPPFQPAPRRLPAGRRPGRAAGLPGPPPSPHRPLTDPQLRGDHRRRQPLLESRHRFQPNQLPASAALGGQSAALCIPHAPLHTAASRTRQPSGHHQLKIFSNDLH